MNKLSNRLLAIFACFLWSTAFVGIKIGYTYYSSPFNFAGLRFTLAGVLLLPLIYKEKLFKILKDNLKFIFFISLAQTGIGYAIFYSAMKYVDGAVAAIVIGASPLITAILSHYLLDNDKMSKAKFLALISGMLGIILISLSTKPFSVNGLKSMLGIGLLLFNSILGGIVNIKISKNKIVINPIVLSSLQMIIGGIFLLIIGRVFEGKIYFDFPIVFYISLLWLAFLSAAAISIWFKLLKSKDIKVSELNMWKFLIPLLGAFLSWIILPNENPNFLSIIGMIIILISLVSYNRIKK
ncbi:drug/metabolite transporter (DMT)-like permease [Hypnocyclicus thermotrophus]|uniref:Drug/metabolite transporter (DMT)-like permease n=1 Tax=Hypnocyclicus thermotrophus TaxID=1627895 RepID=A0AA46DZF7_9FUSO|nr:DMT family transporter [Hypnocyclicus thermotrophus]TDT71770.1 drug/metabolite transporter (DMT)-like permease [Hypnocyclicus thermotrophus]